MRNETADFIVASLNQAFRSYRIWPDIPGTPQEAYELSHAVRFGKQADAARMIEERLLPFLPARLRRAFDRLAADCYRCEAAGVAAWNAAVAVALQAEARRLLKAATASAEKEAKTLEA